MVTDELVATLLATMLSSVITIMVALLMMCIYTFCFSGGSVSLGEGLPGAFDDSERFIEEEASALEIMNDASRQSYLTAKRFIEHHAPNSADTDISLSQFMTIQEKGVAAWEFTYDALQQSNVVVQNRTDIEFTSNEMSCVQTNLPLPRTKEVVYWEVKIYDIAPGTTVSVGLTTKPYPTFRLPGMHRYSVAYESSAIRRLNQPFSAPHYGREFSRGDVIGVGYRVRSSTIFFTHNGKKLEDVVHGMRMNIFPTVGSNGPCTLGVNFGQAGFVFIQAIVKEWGLAPAQGTLAPPPAYGDQDDSVLLESTTQTRGALPTASDQPVPPPPATSPGAGPAPPYVRTRSKDDMAGTPIPGPSGESLEAPSATPASPAQEPGNGNNAESSIESASDANRTNNASQLEPPQQEDGAEPHEPLEPHERVEPQEEGGRPNQQELESIEEVIDETSETGSDSPDPKYDPPEYPGPSESIDPSDATTPSAPEGQ